jgi:hypothetical protein
MMGSDMEIKLEGELLDYFHQFVKWVSLNTSISNERLERVKARAVSELNNDSQKWYFEKDFLDLYNYCVVRVS